MSKTTGGAIVGFVNQKGGTGKTTLSVHVAVAAARAGKKVILVDGDPQGNATSWLLDGDLSAAGLFEMLVVGKPAGMCVRPVSRWGLGILPGNGRTSEAMIFLAATTKPFDTISRVIRPLAGVADYVIVDMPPSRGAGFAEMLFACDSVIIPTQLERLALEGVGLMAETVGQIGMERGRGPRLMGVVPNMVRLTTEHREQLDELVRAFGPAVWPPVPLSVRVAEACTYGTVVFDLAPGEKVTQALGQVAARFLQVGSGTREA